MGTIAALRKGLDKLDIPTEIEAIIIRTSPDIIKLNTDNPDSGQLIHGKNSLGIEISPGYYLLTYSIEKEDLNPLPGFGVPDLKLTGAFYAGFKVDVEKGYFTISSTDEKADMLESKYGIEIYGLTKENLTKYSLNVFYPQLKKYITEKTGLKFR